MQFKQRINAMVDAVERHDSQAVRACFTPNGIYHDVFYGSFQGDEIVRMIDEYFFRDAGDFRWDIHDAVDQGDIGYARYVFSYAPMPHVTVEGSSRGRAIFEGVAICRLENGLIADYREVANAATGLSDAGFPVERLGKFIDKQARELRARPETARHLE